MESSLVFRLDREKVDKASLVLVVVLLLEDEVASWSINAWFRRISRAKEEEPAKPFGHEARDDVRRLIRATFVGEGDDGRSTTAGVVVIEQESASERCGWTESNVEVDSGGRTSVEQVGWLVVGLQRNGVNGDGESPFLVGLDMGERTAWRADDEIELVDVLVVDCDETPPLSAEAPLTKISYGYKYFS